ncbi:MAG: Xaa-Pro peptidase family protein [Gemmatimonadota bacterium]|nr:Xaa-Pro peptidase family protein [Gemmatimonadota bacterium]
MQRRDFIIRSSALAGAAAIAGPVNLFGAEDASRFAPTPQQPSPVVPITADERRARIEKARRLMAQHGIDALVLEGGTSMYYYTGVHWGNSERTFAVVIPARGELAWVTPGFEEARSRELIPNPTDIRAWQEDESPYKLIAAVLRDRKATGTIGIEERLRFFIYDGLRSELPRAKFVSATPVTAGCRMIKSPAEIALLQRANDITLQAIGTTLHGLKEGMTTGDVGDNVAAVTKSLGGKADGALVIFGKYSAFPHGSVQPQRLREGDVVLVDAGCTVEGYVSDITRTTVFGTPTQRQRDVWEVEKKAQAVALAAAQVGATCASVDAAARGVITSAGYGPDYKVPGLPHRTGHGIGLDGHEWTNFVRGNMTRIEPGMCFSDEPTIAIYGEFGIRLEDCLHVTDAGPRLFTPQSPSIEQPI